MKKLIKLKGKNMKKLIALFLICSLLTGCANLKGTGSTVESSAQQNDPATAGDSTVSNPDPIPTGDWLTIDDVETPAPMERVISDNGREDYTVEEVAEILNSIDNFKTSDNFTATVPKHLDHLREFNIGTQDIECPTEEQYKNFLETFKYIFPNDDFHENCFFCLSNGEYYPIYENYDKFIDHTLNEDMDKWVWFLTYTEADSDDEYRIDLTTPYYFGGSISSFNRGKAIKTAYEKGDAEFCSATLSFPEYWFESEGIYPPDSEKSFKLTDKEMSIKDAVKFFEDYVNSLPSRYEPVFSVHVNRVTVYKLTNDCYGYGFSTSRMYDEIPFEYFVDGQHISGSLNIIGDMGRGFMLRSDEADSASGICCDETIGDIKEYTDMMSFEQAANIISEKLTDHVTFEVVDAKLIYCQYDDGVPRLFGDISVPIRAKWSLRLYNPNDALYYFCYLDARNAEDFSYFTAEEIQ